MVRFRDVLFSKNFFSLWSGQIISEFGDRLNQMALISLIYYKEPGSVMAVEGEDVFELEDMMVEVEASLEDAVDFEDLDVVEERLEEVESILMEDFDVIFDDEPDSDSDN